MSIGNVVKINIQFFILILILLFSCNSNASDFKKSASKIKNCVQKKCTNQLTQNENIALHILNFEKDRNPEQLYGILDKYSNNKEFIKNFLTYVIDKHSEYGKKIVKTETEQLAEYMETSDPSNETILKFIKIAEYPKYRKSLQYIVKQWTVRAFSDSADMDIYQHYKDFITQENISDKITTLLLNNDVRNANIFLKFLDGAQFDINLHKIHLHLRCNKDNVGASEIASFVKSKYFDKMPEIGIKCGVSRDDTNLIIASILKSDGRNFIDNKAIYRMQSSAVITALKEKNFQGAIEILNSHTPTNREQYTEHQWLLGWIHLTMLNKPMLAIKNFQNILNSSSYAISAARGNYWLGRAYDALNDRENANEYYKKAAMYPVAFYGQYAIKKLNLKLENIVNLYTKERDMDYVIPELGEIGFLLYLNGLEDLGRVFVQSGFAEISQLQGVMVLNNAKDIFKTQHLNTLSRYVTRFGVFIPQLSYPKVGNEHNIISSIIRQESIFDASLVSEKGAMGMMQVMPQTAKEICQVLKIKYNSSRMLQDRDYNIKIGTQYINQLLKKFDNNLILVAASYNAGPTPVRRWLERFGNPDNMSDIELIQWIESVTYSQTRNYIMRIVENYNMYNVIYN